MDKQKQIIEEMAKDIVRMAGLGVYEKAEYLYDAGYRKESETAEKFAERLKEELENRSAVVGYDLEDLEFDGEIIQECIDEICKEFTEGSDGKN